MTLRNRFLLVGLGMVVFTLTTPLITLYALGYKFDLSSWTIQKTGSLVVQTEPEGALIYLNDVLQPRKTDTTVRFLLPGDYIVRLDKDGYQPWTKNLNIRSRLGTWANQGRDFVTLFLQEPVTEEEHSFDSFAFAAQARQAVVVRDGKILHYDPGSGSLEETPDALPDFNPPVSINNQDILYYVNRYKAARIFTPEQISLASRLEANDSFGAILIGPVLSYAKGGAVADLAVDVSGFALDGDHLWYVQGNTLMRANLRQGVIETVSDLGRSAIDSKIIRGPSNVFLIMDQVLYALNDSLEEIDRNMNYAYWDQDVGRLVAATDHEVKLFDPGTFRSELVIRSTTAINQPVVNHETGYLFFLNEGKVKAIELDGRDHRNVYTIADWPAKAFILDQYGEILTLFTDNKAVTYRIR